MTTRPSQKELPVVTIAAAFIVMCGIVLRLVQYAANRSLWLDEAMLALNITGRSLFELAKPLDFNQGAPIGFLAVEKIATYGLGNEDYVLRLFPLLSGLIAVVLMAKLSLRYLDRSGSLIAVGLFALSSAPIYYASEAKQYSSDSLVSIGLLCIAPIALRQKAEAREHLALLVIGVVAMWISHPAVIIIASIGAALLLSDILKTNPTRRRWVTAVLTGWGLNLALIYFLSLRTLAANSVLVDYWRQGFMPMPPWREPQWIAQAFVAMFRNPVGLSHPIAIGLGLTSFVVGSFSFALKKPRYAVMVLLPFPITMVLSGFQKYPFGDRLLLFILPCVLLLVAEGVVTLSRVIRLAPWGLPTARLEMAAAVVLSAVLIYSPARVALLRLHHPEMREHIRPVMDYVASHRSDQDRIYVYYGATPAFSFYSERYGLKSAAVVFGSESRQNAAKYVEDLGPLMREHRVWFVFSHNCDWCVVDEQEFIMRFLNQRGSRVDGFQSEGASAYLYQFG